jgi:lysozyme
MRFMFGIDVSYYQPRVDWRLVRAQGVRFAFIRATSGMGYVDPCFAAHWADAKQEGILRGAYHYLIAGQDAVRQVNLFISTVGTDRGELPPVLDIEDRFNENLSNQRIINTAKTWLDRVGVVFERKPMVYSRRSYLREHVSISSQGAAPAWAKNYPLWVAQYPYTYHEGDEPLQPDGWSDWKFWQYSSSGMLEGISDTSGRPILVDFDWFRGTQAELYAFANVQLPQLIRYVIQVGDTLRSIATKHNVELRELLDANPGLIQPGNKLTIPVYVNASEIGSAEQPASGTPSGTFPANAPITYKVKPGDTLWAISRKYHTTIEAVAELNDISNVNLIFPGQVLVIPS